MSLSRRPFRTVGQLMVMCCGLLILNFLTTAPLTAGAPQSLPNGNALRLLSGVPNEKPFKFECGMAVVTCSSASRLDNWQPCGNGLSDLANDAYVVAMIDTRDPIGVGAPLGSIGGGWNPAVWHNETSVSNRWNARNLGEVFGIALDDSTPPNVYVTATSIHYGTGRGPGGDGGVYRLSGTNFAISVFQNFAASSSPVGKVSLGNICFDKEHRQFFVTDLDHGSIRRLNMAGAEIVSGGTPYDHGTTGILNVGGTPIPDVSSTPGDLTRSGRRVFGVQVFKSRLYYSVWRAPVSGGVGTNEVWSVGMLSNGDLITTGLTGPRKELTLPGLPPFNQYPTSEPVITDIAFSQDGKMLVGERSICATTPTDLASGSHSARAIEFSFGTSWTQTQMMNVGSVVNVNGRVNSAGGVDYDCAGHQFVSGDALINDGLSFPYTGNAVYGLQIYPTPTTVVSNSWVIDFDGNYTIYDKLSLGDVEVYRCCDCITFSNEQLECVATNTFQWSFCVTNNGTLTNGHLVFVDPPKGVTFNPPIVDINPAIAPGQGFCTTVTVTIDPKFATNQLCFRVAAHTPDYADCCVVTKCLKVPECCAVISKEQVKCDPASGSINWCFNIQNLSGVPVQYAVVIPEPAGCASVAPNVITFNPPLAPFGTANVCIPIMITNSPCDTACFRMVLADTNFTSCCTFVHCVSLRCKDGNHPPVVDCVKSVLLCDPKAGQGYSHSAVVQDPDGDPLTVIWKLNGTPVKTNTVASGISATPTSIPLIITLPPGMHVISVCVSDGNGAPTICETKIEVGDLTPPMITCPPEKIVETWEYVVPNFIQEVVVKDNCSVTNRIKVTQDPLPGTLLPPGRHCITFTAMDQAGNTATCTTCIEVRPLKLVVQGAGVGIFGVAATNGPADLVLKLEGALSLLDTVQYFANGSVIGQQTKDEAGLGLRWSKVPPGNYSLIAEGKRRGVPGATASTQPVLLYVLGDSRVGPLPVFSSAVLQDGKLRLSMQTTEGERCAIEVTDDLSGNVWRTLEQTVGDGQIQTMNLDIQSGAKFFRIRIDR